MERRRWVVSLALGGAALVGTWACDAGTGGEMMADAATMVRDAAETVRDAAEVIRDGGETVRDAMGSDAAAQEMPRDVPCDIERTGVVHSGSTTTTIRHWYAELRDPSIRPDEVAAVRTMVCDQDLHPPYSPELCDDPERCSGVNPSPPRLRCWVGSGAEIEEGVVRVFCGNSTVVRNDDTGETTSETRSRASSVRITLVR